MVAVSYRAISFLTDLSLYRVSPSVTASVLSFKKRMFLPGVIRSIQFPAPYPGSVSRTLRLGFW